MKRAFGYSRISTRELNKNKHSIEDQKKNIQEYCRKNDLQLIDSYSDFLPPHRYMLDQMIARSRQKNAVDVIVVTSKDRLSRDDYELCIIEDFFKKKGIKLIEINS